MEPTNQSHNSQPVPPQQLGTIYAPPHPAPLPVYPEAPKKFPLKTVVGILLAVLLVGGLIFAAFSVYQRMANSGFDKLQPQSAKFGSATLSLDVPRHYEQIQSDEEAKTGIIWSDPNAVGQLRVTSESDVIDADEMVTLVDDTASNTSGQKDVALAGYEAAAKKLCANPKLGDLSDRDIDGALAGYRIDFTCASGSGEQLKGTIMDGMTGKNTVSYTLLLPTEDWTTYKQQIQQSINSFSIRD